MWDRLLCAIDKFESAETALDFVAGIASENHASVRVLHIREVPRWRALCRSSPRPRPRNWSVMPCRRCGCGASRLPADPVRCFKSKSLGELSTRPCSGSARRSSSDPDVFTRDFQVLRVPASGKDPPGVVSAGGFVAPAPAERNEILLAPTRGSGPDGDHHAACSWPVARPLRQPHASWRRENRLNTAWGGGPTWPHS